MSCLYDPNSDLSEEVLGSNKPTLVVSGYCPHCGKPIYGKFMFTFPISLPSEELCMCGQLKSKRFEDTINRKSLEQ